MENVDDATVSGFGLEWSTYDQQGVPPSELARYFELYFSLFPWSELPTSPVGFDLGCGSGRWASFVAPRVGTLHCIDASEDALGVARQKLRQQPNCVFIRASVGDMPIPDGSMDFGYSLGVLHHVPDTQEGIRSCVAKLKDGAPLLLYLYYRFDNKPAWFRAVWSASDRVRRVVSRLPHGARLAVTTALAGAVYLPLARTAKVAEKLGIDVENFPLSAYRDAVFYTMRTDALDRFGTRLEQRFTRSEIRTMMERAGLERVSFRDGFPYWCAIGYKRSS